MIASEAGGIDRIEHVLFSAGGLNERARERVGSGGALRAGGRRVCLNYEGAGQGDQVPQKVR